MVADYSQYDKYMNGHSSDDQGELISPMLNNGFKKPREILFKVIKDPNDVKNCLHLRYITYRYVNFIEENIDRLDIDTFDKYSTFLGAYDVTGENKTLVGTLRIISANEKGECSIYIEEFIHNANDQKIKMLDERSELFPIMESFKLPDSYIECFGKMKSKRNQIYPYEISRLAIRPDYWMNRIDVGLHHLLILESWLHNPPLNDFLIAVHPRARRRYERIGFKIILDTGEVLYKHINQLAIAMIIDLKNYLQKPDSYREICESLLPQYEKNSYFTRITRSRTPLNYY